MWGRRGRAALAKTSRDLRSPPRGQLSFSRTDLRLREAMTISKPRCEVDIVPLTTSPSDLRFFTINSWSSFDPFYDEIEPISQRPPNPEFRIARWCRRIQLLVDSPNTLCLKAVDRKTGQDVACSIWFRPGAPCFNLKRRSKGSKGDDDSMWEGVDEEAWEELWGRWDQTRAELMRGIPHYYLAPLWVLPSHQGLGIGSALLQHVIDECDRHSPPIPIYLEASQQGKGLYKHKFNFVEVGKSDYIEMVRWGKTEKKRTGRGPSMNGQEKKES